MTEKNDRSGRVKIAANSTRFAKQAPHQMDPYDGVLVVDKPSGPTSHDIVAGIRRKFAFKKVGHGGTLDPQATGVLVILIGRGTKLSSRFIQSDKTYEGTVRLGITTDSHDIQGKVLKETDYSSVTRDLLEVEMKKLTGDIMQAPPMLSAVKVDGVPLYKRARKGQTVEREPRLIHVYEFKMTDFRPPMSDFILRCTKGTYVRTLCADIGESLGCGAYLHSLRRTQCGNINISDATPTDDVLGMNRKELLEKIIPMQRFALKRR